MTQNRTKNRARRGEDTYCSDRHARKHHKNSLLNQLFQQPARSHLQIAGIPRRSNGQCGRWQVVHPQEPATVRN